MVHDEKTAAALETEFPGWRVWRTADAGTWWASRRGPQWMCEPRTVAADSAEGLRAELREALAAAQVTS
jgi:hypothetical protein